jgi:hypothetical protein
VAGLAGMRGEIDAALRDRLETMHATVEAWKQQMTPEDFGDEMRMERDVLADAADNSSMPVP